MQSEIVFTISSFMLEGAFNKQAILYIYMYVIYVKAFSHEYPALSTQFNVFYSNYIHL